MVQFSLRLLKVQPSTLKVNRSIILGFEPVVRPRERPLSPRKALLSLLNGRLLSLNNLPEGLGHKDGRTALRGIARCAVALRQERDSVLVQGLAQVEGARAGLGVEPLVSGQTTGQLDRTTNVLVNTIGQQTCRTCHRFTNTV
jgi:hypothetical protein